MDRWARWLIVITLLALVLIGLRAGYIAGVY